MDARLLLSGASGAIGASIKNQCTKRGFQVFTVGKGEDDFRCDFGIASELSTLEENLKPERFDLVILCHALPEQSFEQLSTESSIKEAQRLFLVNYFSITRIVETLYRNPKTTFVLLLGGGAGGRPVQNSLLYSPLKSALCTFVESYGHEIAKYDSAIFGVSPGQVKGGIAKRILTTPSAHFNSAIKEDAKRVETNGRTAEEISMKFMKLLDKFLDNREVLNGRLFSTIHDNLDALESNLHETKYRLRRVID